MARGKNLGVVLDSSFLIAYYNTRDVHHASAARAMLHVASGTWGRALLLEYVFLEVSTVLLARAGLATAADVGRTLLAAEEIDFVPCSDVFLDALEVFRGQSRGQLSFADAAIAAVARERAGGRVVTFDRDFHDLPGITVMV